MEIISTIIIGLLINYIYDKMKNHPKANKGGCELEIKIKFRNKK